MPDVPVPLTILRALADETRRRLELAGQIEHPGESGRAREQILTAFIEQLVPSSFGVSTGFVVDALGGKSRQLDVVVYQTDYAPVFEIGRVKHFLVESVVAVLEVKAAIDSERDLTQALDNIASVKGLDRSNRGRNRLSINRMQISRKADPSDHEAQILGVIVTEKSRVGDFSEDFRAWLHAHPRREWPNLYIDVQRFAALYRYLHPEDRYRRPEDWSRGYVVGTNAMTAEEFVVSEPDPTNEALVVLGYELLNWFRVVPTIDFDPMDYFPHRSQVHQSWPLPPVSSAEEQPPDP
jgi:hypothetical protein